MFVHLTIALAVSVTLGTGSNIPGVITTEPFDHSEILDKDGNYILFWNLNDTHVTFEVHVKTKGYVGFGISNNGDMYPGDVVVGWVKDGATHFSVSTVTMTCEISINAHFEFQNILNVTYVRSLHLPFTWSIYENK